jgi:hypothetical protein
MRSKTASNYQNRRRNDPLPRSSQELFNASGDRTASVARVAVQRAVESEAFVPVLRDLTDEEKLVAALGTAVGRAKISEVEENSATVVTKEVVGTTQLGAASTGIIEWYIK